MAFKGRPPKAVAMKWLPRNKRKSYGKHKKAVPEKSKAGSREGMTEEHIAILDKRLKSKKDPSFKHMTLAKQTRGLDTSEAEALVDRSVIKKCRRHAIYKNKKEGKKMMKEYFMTVHGVSVGINKSLDRMESDAIKMIQLLLNKKTDEDAKDMARKFIHRTMPTRRHKKKTTAFDPDEEYETNDQVVLSPHDLLRANVELPSMLTKKRDRMLEYNKALLKADLKPSMPEKTSKKLFEGDSIVEPFFANEVIRGTGTVELPDNFIPKFTLTMKDTSGKLYTPIGHWITDEVDRLGDCWKERIPESKYKDELYTLAYWIQEHGSVTVRESRMSKFITYK